MRDHGTKHWIITDTHFGHNRICLFEDRPENFALKILGNIQKLVKAGDVLIHLGDFCIGEDVFWHERFMRRKGFKRILIRGNHDRKSVSWYYRHGWDFVADEVTLNMYGAEILLTHKPVMFPGTKLNIHGHMHRKSHLSSRNIYKDAFHRLVYIEHDYRPIPLRTIVETHNMVHRKKDQDER